MGNAYGRAVGSTKSLESISASRPYQKEGKLIFVDEDVAPVKYKQHFYKDETSTSQASSHASVDSEPAHGKEKIKHDFVNTAMADYLNSHRHSISSVLELIDSSDPFKIAQSHYKSFDILKTDSDLQDSITEIEVCEFERTTPDSFYILSPIEEKSEPSTTSSSVKESNGSGKRKSGKDLLMKYSSSCNAIPQQIETEYLPEKYQTFPRVRNESTFKGNRIHEIYYDKNTMYPLEPRELDPSAFFQLHTADSQEELQEFLLLESECMGDANGGRGLASAFDESAYIFSSTTDQ